MLPEKIIFVGVLISLIGAGFYIKDIIYGTTKPNRVTWFIWMLAPLVGAFLQFKAGAGINTFTLFAAGLGPLLVLIASFWNKNSYWKITFFDIICGVFALIALLFYVLTHKFGISILFAILSDFLAGIPTLTKSWKFPETETGLEYFCAAINVIIGSFAIKNWMISIYSFNAYLIAFNLVVVFFIYRKKLKTLLK